MFLKLEKSQLMGLSSWLDKKSKLGRWTMAMSIHPDVSFRRKRWNSREARFKMIVTEYFLELKDKYLQMENTLWVVDKIKKKIPYLDTSQKNRWTLKIYKNIKDKNKVFTNGKELAQDKFHGKHSFGLCWCGNTGCQIFPRLRPGPQIILTTAFLMCQLFH